MVVAVVAVAAHRVKHARRKASARQIVHLRAMVSSAAMTVVVEAAAHVPKARVVAPTGNAPRVVSQTVWISSVGPMVAAASAVRARMDLHAMAVGSVRPYPQGVAT